MVMGVPSNATNAAKVPFCPCSSSIGGHSFRYLSLGSSKALRRREVCIIQSVYKTFPEISMLSSLPRFHRSCYHVRTSAAEKYSYILTTDASPAKMIPLYQNQNFFDNKHSSKEIISQQKFNEKREQVSRNCSTSPIQEVADVHFLGKPTFPRKNRSSTLKDWDEATENLRRNRKQALDQIKTECLQDGSSYTSGQDLFFSGRSYSLHSKSMDNTSTQDQTYCGKGSWHDLNFKCRATSVPADTEEKVAKNNNSAAMNHVNGEISRFGKVHPYPAEHLEKENVMIIPQEIMDKPEEVHIEKILEKENSAAEKGHSKKSAPSNGVVETTIVKEEVGAHHPDLRKKLATVYKDVKVVDNVADAKKVVKMLTTQYRNLVHACDTEVANIDVKQETPVDHGEVICFSIYSGPNVDFGDGKSCIWVDVLDGGGSSLLKEFAPFFQDPSIKKVWHNYSFDNHVIENYGIKLSGFHADTMHMARLWDSSRRTEGGYSLEALTGDQRVMSGAEMRAEKDLIGKISMKAIFGRKKLKKDGTEGKIINIPPVEELQREEREPWICYSALDAISTLKLYESLRQKLEKMSWKLEWKTGTRKMSMFDFYLNYWQPFGEILVKMETEGMLVDRNYLAEIEKVAKKQQEVAVNRFHNWAAKQCADAKYMNVGSDSQLRQLLFGGTMNRKDFSESLPYRRVFKVPNTQQVIEEGKKTPSKYRNIELKKIGGELPTEMYTATGWPSVSGDALKILAGNISAEYDFTEETDDSVVDDGGKAAKAAASAYGTAYEAFGGGQEGKEACHAIASLCEVCSIDSLISNFILPLQGSNVSGKNGRVHCSLNINTETGRLSARRPNLQNQPALEKDRYKIRQAFIASPGNSLIVADYGQLELRILAHLANCKSMLDAFKAGGDFHSRTAMNMYPHIRHAIETEQVILEWHPEPGEDKPPVPLLKDAFGSERRKAKMLNFSIAYGKTPVGLARDWKVSVEEAKNTVDLWYGERQEVLAWQEARKEEARKSGCVHTLLGRARRFPSLTRATRAHRNHIERAAINTPVQGSAADVAMCAMLEITKNARLKELGWKLLLQVHDEVILEGPSETAEIAKDIVVDCMSKPFNGKNMLKVDLAVDAKCAQNWYAAK